MPRFRTSRGDIKEPVRLMFFPWRMSSNFMRCVFPGIIGLSEYGGCQYLDSGHLIHRYGMPPALWGVCTFRYLLLCVRYFNSRDHSWRDKNLPLYILHVFQFQLTRPRKARPIRALWTNWLALFQLTRPRKARPQYIDIKFLIHTIYNITYQYTN